jgi:hypothetical protein
MGTYITYPYLLLIAKDIENKQLETNQEKISVVFVFASGLG